MVPDWVSWVGAHDLGQAKVGQQRPVRFGQQDVAGLDVTVHHPLAMGIVQGGGHLCNDRGDLVGRHGRPKQFVEGAGVNVFHDQVGHAVLLAVVHDDQDVGVPQLGDRPGLLPKALDEGLVLVGEVGRQDLHGHVAFQRRLVGLEHRAHAPLADLLQDLISAQSLADDAVHT